MKELIFKVILSNRTFPEERDVLFPRPSSELTKKNKLELSTVQLKRMTDSLIVAASSLCMQKQFEK